MESHEARRELPRKIILIQHPMEPRSTLLLRLLGFVLFHRDRLAIQSREHLETLPFLPDLIQLDFELRPSLWVECGDCSVEKLDRLAVKAPGSEIWVIKKTMEEAEVLMLAMKKHHLRTNRYSLLAFEALNFGELESMLKNRNELVLHSASFETPGMQFEFNGLWFDESFKIFQF